MKLIIGLGNPGDKYLGSRHNIGFEVVDKYAGHIANREWQMEEKFKSEIIKTGYQQSAISHQLILAKPQTYMNKSGLAVVSLVNYFKIKPEDIIVVHDELDLLLGHIKVRIGGSDAGHHGIESIIKILGTDKFIRIRLGIGIEKTLSGEHKKVFFNAENFVMEPFKLKEKSEVKSLVKKAIKALDLILEKGVESAQNQYN